MGVAERAFSTPRASGGRDRVQEALDAVDVDAGVRLVVLRDPRARAHALDVRDAERPAEDQVAVDDRELEAVERADGRPGLPVALRVVETAVARAAEARREHRSELHAVDFLLRLLVDRAVRLDGTPEVDAAAVDRREAGLTVLGEAVVPDERRAARHLTLVGVLEERRD